MTSQTEENFEISIDDVSKKFESHLEVENNYRIIFSGKYGTGKSYFLRRFFKDRESRYNTFFLSPVNYVISSNEDIFELIKVDIIKQLFFEGHIIPKKAFKKSTGDVTWQMIHEKPFTIVKNLVSTFKKISPELEITNAFLIGVDNLIKEYKLYEKELSKKLNPNEEYLTEFINGYVEGQGNIFEENFITRTINVFLEKISKGEKENVLVIDDLDRIDPEHIFRVLNILSAHNDHWDKTNKFQFNKVVLVCDIDNIEKTFLHRYGDVDFSGYIDKFYSTDIFSFSNEDAIKTHVNYHIGNHLSDPARKFLAFVLNAFVETKQLTLRKIIKSRFKLPDKNYSLGSLSFKRMDRRIDFIEDNIEINFYSDDFEMLGVIKILSMVFGDFNQLKNVVTSFNGNLPTLKYSENKELLIFLVLPYHLALNSISEKLLFYEEKVSEYQVGYHKPSVHLMDIGFEINHNWKPGNAYSGENNYFSKVLIRNMTNQRGEISYRVNKWITKDSIQIDTAKLMQSFSSILIGFERNKFLTGYGI